MVKSIAVTALLCLGAVNVQATYVEMSGYVTYINGDNSKYGVRIGDPFYARIDYVVFSDYSLAYLAAQNGSSYGPVPVYFGPRTGEWVDIFRWTVQTPWGAWGVGSVDGFSFDLNPDGSSRSFAAGGCCDSAGVHGEIGADPDWSMDGRTGAAPAGFIGGPITSSDSAAKPEPATALLIPFGLSVLVWLRRRSS